MYLWWQFRRYVKSWEPGENPPDSYSLYLAESVRAPGQPRPKRHIVLYLGSVTPHVQKHGRHMYTSVGGQWSPCHVRCLLWSQFERRLAKAVADDRIAAEQRVDVQAELARFIPPPSPDHPHGEGGDYWYHPGYDCQPEPMHLPDAVSARRH